MDGSDKVKTFFERWARQFDSYYLEKKKPFSWKVLDYLFRRSMNDRLQLTLQECKTGRNVTILDVGCGSGRCAVRLLRQSPCVLTGIDFSPEMIKIANEVVLEYRVQDRCRFILGEFGEIVFNEKFDICVALGFFDYTKNPEIYLRKMKQITTGKIIASFPAKWRLRNLIRITRLKILNCPVYFYTVNRIKQILRDASIDDYKIRCIGRDYFVVARLS